MLEGHHFQNAYVTRDVDKGIDAFRQRGSIRHLLTYEGAVDVTTPDGPATATNKIALIWVGDLQYELIQPISGAVRLYQEGLPEGDGLRFHHACMRVPDWQAFRARVADQPYPVALEGGSDALRFLYLDARPLLGHFLEYTWMTDERWTQMGGN